jgi:hypothetical protein
MISTPGEFLVSRMTAGRVFRRSSARFQDGMMTESRHALLEEFNSKNAAGPATILPEDASGFPEDSGIKTV